MNQSYKVIWSHRASKDLEQIIAYIATDSPSDARQILIRTKNGATSLCRFPERGRVVPELQAQGVLQYRELMISPWRLICRISKKEVYVLTVIDARQNVEDILLQRFTDGEVPVR